jgi:hypothetical protein
MYLGVNEDARDMVAAYLELETVAPELTGYLEDSTKVIDVRFYDFNDAAGGSVA